MLLHLLIFRAAASLSCKQWCMCYLSKMCQFDFTALRYVCILYLCLRSPPCMLHMSMQSERKWSVTWAWIKKKIASKLKNNLQIDKSRYSLSVDVAQLCAVALSQTVVYNHLYRCLILVCHTSSIKVNLLGFSQAEPNRLPYKSLSGSLGGTKELCWRRLPMQAPPWPGSVCANVTWQGGRKYVL